VSGLEPRLSSGELIGGSAGVVWDSTGAVQGQYRDSAGAPCKMNRSTNYKVDLETDAVNPTDNMNIKICQNYK